MIFGHSGFRKTGGQYCEPPVGLGQGTGGGPGSPEYFLYFKFSHIYDAHNSISLIKLSKSNTSQFQQISCVANYKKKTSSNSLFIS